MCHPSSITGLLLGVGKRRRKAEFWMWGIEKQGENCATNQLRCPAGLHWSQLCQTTNLKVHCCSWIHWRWGEEPVQREAQPLQGLNCPLEEFVFLYCSGFGCASSVRCFIRWIFHCRHFQHTQKPTQTERKQEASNKTRRSKIIKQKISFSFKKNASE